MTTTAHIERVNAAGRNDVYAITLGCSCKVRHEPDAPSPFDWEMRSLCPVHQERIEDAKTGWDGAAMIADAKDAFDGWDGK